MNENVTIDRKACALENFTKKCRCSQSVLLAFKDLCGLTEEECMKVSGCFGGGMRKGEVCGACTGALMVLGCLYGQYDLADAESRVTADRVTHKMMDEFKAACGSYLCKDILADYDTTTPEGAAAAHSEVCPGAIAKAVEIVEKIIAEEK